MSALKELFPDVAVIRRTGVINAWRWPAFRMAIEATGRKKLIIAAISDSTRFWGKERCPEEEFGEQTNLRKIEIYSSDFRFVFRQNILISNLF